MFRAQSSRQLCAEQRGWHLRQSTMRALINTRAVALVVLMLARRTIAGQVWQSRTSLFPADTRLITFDCTLAWTPSSCSDCCMICVLALCSMHAATLHLPTSPHRDCACCSTVSLQAKPRVVERFPVISSLLFRETLLIMGQAAATLLRTLPLTGHMLAPRCPSTSTACHHLPT